MMEPEVRYCTTADGVRIAYTVTGEGPPVVCCVEPIVSHVQLEWAHPVSGPILREFARNNTLVRFDFRGCGLSDRRMGESLDEYVRDIEAVVERTGLKQFALTSVQSSTPAALIYAARHPERVTRFAIWDGFARMSDLLNTPQAQALLAAAKVDWVLATEAIGFMAYGSGQEPNKMHGEFIRQCIGPEYVQAVDFLLTFDATEFAQQVMAPTLVLKHIGIQFVTMESTKDLVARIPNAQLLVVEGMWTDQLDETMRRSINFINGGIEPALAAPDLPFGTAIILFADIVDSTALTERLGDTAFRDKAHGLDEAMRAAIRADGGTAVEGKTLGDGVLAVFTSAKQAIACARACHEAAEAAGLSLHAGIHAGDVIRKENNVYGGAVNIAARIAAASAAGETLVSDTVRSLARTSAGVAFEDRGDQSLKGIDDPVRVFAVILREQ